MSELHFLHEFIPRQFDSDFQFVIFFPICELFLGSSAVVFWTLDMFQFIIFSTLSTCWLRGEASWESGLCCGTLLSPLGFDQRLTVSEQASVRELVPTAPPLSLGCIPVCEHLTLKYQLSMCHSPSAFTTANQQGYLSVFSWQILECDREILRTVPFPTWFRRNGVEKGVAMSHMPPIAEA